MTATQNVLDGIQPELKQHPLSAAFPAMADADFQALQDSIELVGVQNAIVLYQGQVIDGWHRYRAAQATLCACPAIELDDSLDPRDFVIAQNERRRHLTPSQIAAAVVAVHGWHPAGRPKTHQYENPAPGSAFSKTSAELAEIAGVSERTIRQAKQVQTNAIPEVQAAVKAGTVSLKTAAAIAKQPAEKQKAAASAGELKKAAQAIQSTAPDPDESIAFDEEPIEERMKSLLIDLDATLKENERMAKIIEADDHLAASMAENKRLASMCNVLESRITGLLNELAEAKRMLKSAQRRADKAEAELKKVPF